MAFNISRFTPLLVESWTCNVTLVLLKKIRLEIMRIYKFTILPLFEKYNISSAVMLICRFYMLIQQCNYLAEIWMLLVLKKSKEIWIEEIHNSYVMFNNESGYNIQCFTKF